MKILVTAATANESQFIEKHGNVTVAVTGVGAVSAVYKLGKLNIKSYDFILNIGIAGSFTENIATGDVVCVHKEVFGDFGVLTGKGFSTCFEENIVPAGLPPYTNGELICSYAQETKNKLHIPLVKGVTNNTVSGEENRIEAVKNKFSPDIETMEGAAFFYVCLKEGVPFAAIRAISNMVQKRDKSKWDIPLAIKNLSTKVNSYINILQSR